MPSRRKTRRSPRQPPRLVPCDFWGIAQASSKIVNLSDLSMPSTRAMRPYKATISAAVVSQSQNPGFQFSIHGPSDTDNITVSRNIVLGSTARSITAFAPRMTDFGDYPAENTPVITMFFPGYYNGTITFSGTVWFQIAPHRVMSKVALTRLFDPDSRDPGDDLSGGYVLAN